jgi:NAD(P)H-dependent flavin oxidoreductase YrpB (nitropropane dioxygenase family)
MGVGVSDWRLANAVARTGELGVVSGTMMDTVLVRRLQDGDPGGHMRRAAAHFPIPGAADEVLERYFIEGGKQPDAPYKALPMYKQVVSDARQRVTMLANFVEVWLAREGHANPVGINLLTKVQMPNLPSLYGAMLAGVSFVIMGAGIPREIPGALDALATHQPARLRLDVEGLARGEEEWLDFNPRAFWPANATLPTLERPRFIAVVSAASLAMTLARKSTGQVNGFVVEAPTAGGHNAPPRGEMQLNERGEPIYGERDVVDLEKMKEIGLPFWLAGGTGSPEGLRRALDAGAAGIQVGTLFAFSAESGLSDDVKSRVIAGAIDGTAELRTDPRASPTGYPFKVVDLPGDAERGAKRQRVCDLGYLRVAAKGPDGRMVYRCAAEPVDTYVAKGGTVEDTEGRRCLCNGLASNIGLGQVREGGVQETTLVTSGDDLLVLKDFFAANPGYTAQDAVEYLAAGIAAANIA